MDINPEIRERILSAAQQLFEQSGRLELPIVDAVRRLSKTNMNDASAVMKNGGACRSFPPLLPSYRCRSACSRPVNRLERAMERGAGTRQRIPERRAGRMGRGARGGRETARRAVSAFETQGAELETVKGRLAETEAGSERGHGRRHRARGITPQVAALTDQAHTATARASEIEKRAEDLKPPSHGASCSTARNGGTRSERAQHGKTRDRMEATGTELVTIKARAEAQASMQAEQAQRYSVRTPNSPRPGRQQLPHAKKPPSCAARPRRYGRSMPS